MSDYKYFGFISKRDLGESTWEELLLNADSDYTTFIMVVYQGLEMGTSLWLSQQSIEKYLKSWLLRSNVEMRGHDLEALYDKAHKVSPKSEIFNDCRFHTLIKELNLKDDNGKAGNHHIRYQMGIGLNSPGFEKIFALLCETLRREILGEDAFKERGTHGLCDATFGGGFYTKNKDVKKLLLPFMEYLLK